MDHLDGKDSMIACSETFLRLQYEVWVPSWKCSFALLRDSQKGTVHNKSCSEIQKRPC